MRSSDMVLLRKRRSPVSYLKGASGGWRWLVRPHPVGDEVHLCRCRKRIVRGAEIWIPDCCHGFIYSGTLRYPLVLYVTPRSQRP